MVVEDKFIFADDGTYEPANNDRRHRTPASDAARNVKKICAWVPKKWRFYAYDSAGNNEKVEILAVFKQQSYGIVYLVKWPDADEGKEYTFAPSLALRTKHTLAMVQFLHTESILPHMQLLLPDDAVPEGQRKGPDRGRGKGQRRPKK